MRRQPQFKEPNVLVVRNNFNNARHIYWRRLKYIFILFSAINNQGLKNVDNLSALLLSLRSLLDCFSDSATDDVKVLSLKLTILTLESPDSTESVLTTFLSSCGETLVGVICDWDWDSLPSREMMLLLVCCWAMLLVLGLPDPDKDCFGFCFRSLDNSLMNSL